MRRVPAQIAAALEEVLKRWNLAARPYSPADLAAVYTDDALFFGGLPHHSVGRAQIEHYFRQYGDTLPWLRLEIRDEHVRQVSEGCLLFQGFAYFDFGLPDGRTTHNTLRATLGLKQASDGEWRIFLHHFSPPPLTPPIPR
jgi:uncharacterized protein (TIGR02246 family)